MKRCSKNHKRGFTLIEIMMAAAISIMLALAAAPYFTSRLPRYEMENTTNEISGYLRTVRNEAISRNETLSFKFISASHELEVYDGDDVLIKTFDIVAYNHSEVNFGSNTAFLNSQGQLLASSTSMDYTTLTITVGDSRSTDTRQIRITSNGRITIHEG